MLDESMGPNIYLISNVNLGSSVPSNTPTNETCMVPESVQPNFSGEETLQMSMSNSILDGELVRNGVGHDGGEMSILSKRKGMTVDMDSDVSASLSKDDNCNFIPNASPSMSGGNVIGTDGPYSKRVRYELLVGNICQYS